MYWNMPYKSIRKLQQNCHLPSWRGRFRNFSCQITELVTKFNEIISELIRIDQNISRNWEKITKRKNLVKFIIMCRTKSSTKLTEKLPLVRNWYFKWFRNFFCEITELVTKFNEIIPESVTINRNISGIWEKITKRKNSDKFIWIYRTKASTK